MAAMWLVEHRFRVCFLCWCLILVIIPSYSLQASETKARNKVVVLRANSESIGRLRALLSSLQQSPFPDGVHNGLVICPSEYVNDHDIDQLVAWSRTWTTVEVWSCSGVLPWLNTTIAALTSYGSALWIDTSVRVDAREIARAFTVIETQGGFLVEAEHSQVRQCTCNADKTADAFHPSIIGLHESLSRDLHDWHDFVTARAPTPSCTSDCLSDLVLTDIAHRYGIGAQPADAVFEQSSELAPEPAGAAEHVFVLLTDNRFLPRAVVLAHHLNALRLAAALPIDLALLLWHDVAPAARALLRERLPGVMLQDCTDPHRWQQTVHYCKFDLFTSSSFRQRRSVLYLDVDQFVLDGAALLALLLEDSADKVWLCGAGAPISEEFEFSSAAEMQLAFGHDPRLFAMKVYNTRMIRFDPAHLPAPREMEARIELAVQRFARFSLYYEQGTLNALFAAQATNLNATTVTRALFHTFHKYDPSPELAFAAMYRAAAGPGAAAAAIGCAFFRGEKPRQVLGCAGSD